MGEATTAFNEGQQILEETAQSGGGESLLGRSTFLGNVGKVLFGAAVATLLPNPTRAWAPCGDSSPCWGFPLCCGGCCGNNQCHSACNVGWLGCPSGGQCWFTCSAGGKYIKCCDCRGPNEGNQNCICRFNVGTC